MDLVVLAEDTRAPAVVAVAGEVDVYTAPVFRSALDDVISTHRQVVVNMVETTFIDSGALGVLVLAFKRLRQRGGVLRVVVTHANLLRLFASTGLDRVIPLHGDLADALAAFPPADGQQSADVAGAGLGQLPARRQAPGPSSRDLDPDEVTAVNEPAPTSPSAPLSSSAQHAALPGNPPVAASCPGTDRS